VNVNGYIITELGPGWHFRFAADNPKSGYGRKFFSLEAAIDWCMRQVACVGCGG
jgi:hypothetical protein